MRLLAGTLILAGVVCLFGPGRFLPFWLEGSVLLVVSRNHGLTVLDLVAFGLIAAGCRVLYVAIR